MPKKKPDHEKAKKISISIPRAIWNLAENQMFHRRQGESEYIRELIKKDTHDLWMQQNQSAPMLKAAEDTPEYGTSQKDSTDLKKRAGADILKASENFGSSPSTRMKASSRKIG